jgi:ATP-dependent DNA helicase RecQ
VRPSSVEKMKRISGIGETRLREYGQAFWEVIRDHCQRWNVAMDQPLQPAARSLFAPRPTEQRPNASRDLALDLFKKGTSLDEVARQTAKTRGTVIEYLIEYLRRARPARLEPWVHRTIYEQVAAAARKVGKSPLKPIFLELGEQVSYDEIKLVLAHLEATGAE